MTIAGGSSPVGNVIKQLMSLEGCTVAETLLVVPSMQIPRECFSCTPLCSDLSVSLLLSAFGF
jgi:hypothetical protein